MLMALRAGQVQTVQLEVSASVCPHINMTETLTAAASAPSRWEQKRKLFVGITEALSLIISQDEEVRGRAEGGQEHQ